MLCRSTEARQHSRDGFTLIEVLVALSIVATGLVSIGALFASTIRGARSVETRLNRLEIARAVITALPDREQLTTGKLAGEIAGHSWQVNVSPFPIGGGTADDRVPWRPQMVLVTVRSPAGDAMQVSTVRLQRKSGG